MGAPREIIIMYKSKVRGVLRAWQVMVFFLFLSSPSSCRGEDGWSTVSYPRGTYPKLDHLEGSEQAGRARAYRREIENLLLFAVVG